MKKTLALTLLLLFVVSAMCAAKEVKIDDNNFLISAKTIQDTPTEVVKARVKKTYKDGHFFIRIYLINRDTLEVTLTESMMYDEKGKYSCSFEHNEKFKRGDLELIDKITDESIKMADKEGD